MCGADINEQNKELVGWLREAGLAQQCRLLGVREDMPRLTAALDVASSTSSYGEGFPIVLGEAMACGVPCVVTDVGDSASIVDLFGRVVATQNADSLANAWEEILTLSREQRIQLGQAARYRIEQNYSLPVIVKRYENLYRKVVELEGMPLHS